MNLIRPLFFFFFISLASNLSAQSFDWVQTMGGGAGDINQLLDASADDQGNVYLTVQVFNAYRPAPGEPLMVAPGEHAGVIQKNDEDGNLVWAKMTEGSGRCYGSAIDVDDQGNVYVAGSFNGEVDFDPGTGVALENSPTTEWTGFLLKLDDQGDFIWVRTFRNGLFEFNDLQVGPDQHIALTGYFRETVDFNPSGGVTNITASGFMDIFLMKMSSSGSLMWAKGFGSSTPHYEEGREIAIDPFNNIYFTGYYRSIVDFDPNVPGSGELTHQESYESDIFVTKFSGTGSFLWARSPANQQRGEAITVDDDGNCYIATQDATYSPIVFSSSIYSYRADGSFERQLNASQGDGYERYMDIELSPDQSSFMVIGSFDEELDLGNNAIPADWVSENGFLARFDTTGNDLWVRKIGRATLTDWKENHPYNIMLPAGGDFYLAGRFAQETDFNPGSMSSNHTPAGEVDAYLLKLVCIETSGQLDTTACFSYVSPSQHYTWDSSGVYHDTIANRYGCDSILTINLTINEVDSAIKQTDSLLIALEDSASYRWVSCDLPSVVLDSAQSFAPPGSGQYALVVEKNGCSAMSDCFAYTALGLTDVSALQTFELYPNPTSDRVTFSWKGSTSERIQLLLHDALGQTLRSWQSTEHQQVLDLSGIPSGLYWLVVRGSGDTLVKKLIIQ